MKSRFTGYRAVALVFWCLAGIAIAVWSQVPHYVVGWDLQVYQNAIKALHAGHDPYADGMAVQRVYHAQLAQHEAAHDPTPFTYVYSPITLPILRVIGSLPFTLSGTIYWLLYAVSLLVAILACLWSVEERERKVFALLAPSAVFFPGLLQNDVLFSGNVAYIVYGLVLGTAWLGWRRNDWKWFYLAALAASCCKAPLLTLLAIPVLSARKQWIPTAITAVAGCALFAVQPLLWPALFRNYLEAVELQFSFNRDFSSSPAGLTADALYDVIPYRITSAGFYLFYAIPAFLVLVYLSRKYFAGYFTLKRWVPVVLVGTVFINPRIMEYDVAPITIAMALVAWRVFARAKTLGRTILFMSLFFAAINLFAARTWRPTECLTLTGIFFAGVIDLFLIIREVDRTRALATS